VSHRKQKMSPQDAQKTADHARQNLPCEDCGAAPGEPCTQPGKDRSVCKPRFIAAAIEVRRQARAARLTPELATTQATTQAATLAALPRVSREEIEACRTPAGGYSFTRERLASWGVPWPPPAGWLRALLRQEDSSDVR